MSWFWSLYPPNHYSMSCQNPQLDRYTNHLLCMLYVLQVQYGCQNLNETCLQFTHDGAFIKIEQTVEQFVEVEMEFRTLKKDGLLMYSSVERGEQKGFMQVRIVMFL